MEDLLKKATIMVVDDTPANLDLLTDMLKTRGYGVTAFPSAAMAIKAAEKNPPDLILLDIMMPEMDGFEACCRLKADSALKDIPVLFISALTEMSDKLKAFSVGGEDYITKPFHFEEIHARVATHLKLRFMRVQLEEQNRNLEKMVEEKVKEISRSQIATIVALSKLAESRDDETGAHIERTRIFCRILAAKLKEDPYYSRIVDKAFIHNIFHAAAMHDIGKVGITDNILLKPDRLTQEEFETIKTHTLIGARTLENARKRYPDNAFLNMGIEIARSHHERWDGSGYPDGLVQAEIPLSARIMALADVYEALRSKRPYKEPFSHEKSVRIIMEGAGKHFDPAVAIAFEAVEKTFERIRKRMN